jgi:hypothetical protein
LETIIRQRKYSDKVKFVHLKDFKINLEMDNPQPSLFLFRMGAVQRLNAGRRKLKI